MGSSSTPPAKPSWALILGLVRHIVAENNVFKIDRPWQSIIEAFGLGKIDSRIAHIGKTFGVKVLA